MKKSVVALAVLGAFTSVAFAQSSVTLYGRIDQNMTLQTPGNYTTIKGGSGLGKEAMKINDGGVNGINARAGEKPDIKTTDASRHGAVHPSLLATASFHALV